MVKVQQAIFALINCILGRFPSNKCYKIRSCLRPYLLVKRPKRLKNTLLSGKFRSIV